MRIKKKHKLMEWWGYVWVGLVSIVAILFIVLYALEVSEDRSAPNVTVSPASTALAHRKAVWTRSEPPASEGRSLQEKRVTSPERLPTFVPVSSDGPFARFARIYYINLDRRPDRRHQIERELRRMGVPMERVERIPGVVVEGSGALGCSRAHLQALTDAKEQGYGTILVLEDDFMFALGRQEVYEQLTRFWGLQCRWDVLMLASNTLDYTPTPVDFLVRVAAAQTTAGYAVHADFLDTLIDNVSRGIELLTGQPKTDQYCIDQFWKSLQPVHHWLTFSPVLAHQRDDYSDIEHRQTNYTDKRLPAGDSSRRVRYLFCIKTCRPRLKRSKALAQSLEWLEAHHPVQCWYYLADPELETEFEVALPERVVTVRAADDYLNIAHKIGQMFHWLSRYVVMNRLCEDVQGCVFLDDDVELRHEQCYDFVEARRQLPYWGNRVHNPAHASDHLIAKSEQSEPIRKTILDGGYDDLLSLKVQTPETYFCSGGLFYLTLPTVMLLSNRSDVFAPFPLSGDLHFYRKSRSVDQKKRMRPSHVFDGLHVFDDLEIGVTLQQMGIESTWAPMAEIVHWEGL